MCQSDVRVGNRLYRTGTTDSPPPTFEDRLEKNYFRGGWPGIRLVTLGWLPEGFGFDPDWKSAGPIQKKLEVEGYGLVPKEHIFNTMETKGSDVDREHFQTCTGYNLYILASVWKNEQLNKS